MNAPPVTPADGGALTKPHDWAIYMVAAALKCVSDSQTAQYYVSADEAKHGILKTLNWLEAHRQYEWPDFAGQHYSFDQVMRLRRVLVANIYNALQKAGSIKLGVPGTPESNAGSRRRRRSSEQRRYSIKKRSKQDPGVDEDATSQDSTGGASPHEGNVQFLDDVMVEIVSRSRVDVEKCMKDGKRPVFVADLIHDELVETWDKPLQDEGEHAQSLKQRAEAWEQHKRSIPPVSSQRERTATPQVTPVPPQTSPGTVHKHVGGSAPTTGPSWDTSGWTAADKTWAHTNSIG